MTAALVELFAEPIRDRLRLLTGRADLVADTQAELRGAAVTAAEQDGRLAKATAAVSEHWRGNAANRFADRAAASRHTLTTVAESLAVADVVVSDAAAAIHTGRAAVRRLLDEYTVQGNKVLAAAAKLVGAGHPTALLGVVGYLPEMADGYVTEADAAVRTARQALTMATRDLTELEALFPQQKRHAAHVTAHVTTSPTKVDLGHGLGTVTAPNARAATAVRAALSQLGVPYVWAGESPGHAFDCSGLTAWAYGRAGISLPHFASSQRIGKRVSEKDLQPGDLVIFSGHVTMYIGKGHVVAAPYTGTDVQIQPLFTSIPGDPFLGFYRPSVRA